MCCVLNLDHLKEIAFSSLLHEGDDHILLQSIEDSDTLYGCEYFTSTAATA